MAISFSISSATGGTFQSDTPGTFVSAVGGTIDSAMPGTFESDTGGTFNPLLSPSPPRGLPLLLPRAGETVAAEAVHRLARPHALQARPRRPSVPDRRLAHALEGEAVTVGSRQTLHSSPWRSFRSRFSVCQPCGFNPSQPPKGGAITPGLRRRFESPPVPGSAS